MLESSSLFFSFLREIKLIMVLSYASKKILAQKTLARCYTTTQILMFPITTIFFSCVKLSKEVCVHHIEHKPALLIVEEFFFYYCSSK